MLESLRRGLTKEGLERIELSWMLEDNLPMRRVIESIGGRICKTYRIFEKSLAVSVARQALVLAASRPQDPVARHAGQSHKALVPVGGVPMLIRVPRALRASRSIGGIAVCLEAGAPVAGACPSSRRCSPSGR